MKQIKLDGIYKPDAAAAFLGVEPRTLEAWRYHGKGPAFVRISARAVRYREKDLVEWIKSRLISPTRSLKRKTRLG